MTRYDKLNTIQQGYKIILNASYGKFASKYSTLYAPDMLLQVTLTGQLTMLMLIEQLEKNGISVGASNTDSVSFICPKDKVDLANAIIFDIELESGLNFELEFPKAQYYRDINNYIAVYDGYTKAKGIYAETTLSKGRSTPIVYEAVRKYLLDGTSVTTTLFGCADMHQFVSARTVKGGGMYDGEYLGKMVRWYYSKSSKGFIYYKLNDNKVPKTDGAKPMMDMKELVDVIPDLDYGWYFDEAVTALKNLGVTYVV